MAQAGPKPESYWNVDDVRAGMKGQGRTVMRGTKIETFDALVLGVLKNTSPGRDMVLCRLSGLNLDNTGVIAGMSGSPVYLDNKLLGAVAYAWPFGKEPIAGVTPFSQMHGFVEAYERRDLAEQVKPVRVGLNTPVQIEGREFDSVTVSESYDDAVPAATDGLWMIPLRTPLCASGFTPHSLSVSLKMGSPLRTVGVINADVSTCIAGWLERKPDLIPVRMAVQGCPGEASKTFNVQIVRQRSLLPALVFASLINSIDMQGDLPEELTADLTARVEVEGHAPLVIQDTYSGPLYTGGRAPPALYAPVANLINLLTVNSFKPIRINRIECETRIRPDRRPADIDAVDIDSET